VQKKYVLVTQGVARVHPLEIFSQTSAQSDFAKQGILFLPLGLLLHKDIDAMVHVHKFMSQ
jgi:hypothetical protein